LTFLLNFSVQSDPELAKVRRTSDAEPPSSSPMAEAAAVESLTGLGGATSSVAAVGSSLERQALARNVSAPPDVVSEETG